MPESKYLAHVAKGAHLTLGELEVVIMIARRNGFSDSARVSVDSDPYIEAERLEIRDRA